MPYKHVVLKSLELYEEEYYGCLHHFLKGVWEYEKDDGRYELTIPKMDLGNRFFSIPAIDSCYSQFETEHYAHVGLEQLPLREDEAGHTHYIKTLEQFEREMTIEEVEQKLGYKVKLVSGKEE